jgi:hypothetical protein
MACFLAPLAEALVATSVTKIVEKIERKKNVEISVRFSRKIKWLDEMLWGGSALLAFEHAWHGEIVPHFPFFTGAENLPEMMREIFTRGTAMAFLVTAVWACMVFLSQKKSDSSVAEIPGAAE